MKKFFVSLLLIGLCVTPAFAESRYITVQQGIPYFHGHLPTRQFVGFSSCDPYMVKIDGTKYYLAFVSGTNFDYNSLVGCTGATKYDLFTPLRNLERDGAVDKITGDELRAAGVRLVSQKFDDTLAFDDTSKDFDLSKIAYIDMTRLRITPATVAYGNFDLYVKTSGKSLKKVIGKVQMLQPSQYRYMFR